MLAYSVYGMIRAMIDQDFSETPEQIEIMFAEHKSIQSKSFRMEKDAKKL